MLRNLTIKQKLTRYNYSDASRGRGQIEYIVIHFYGDLGTAAGVADWFASQYVGASAHYAVDETTTVWQSVLDEDIAWHCGAYSYIHPKCRNSNSIGIELRPNKINRGSINAYNTDWYFEPIVIDHAVELTMHLMEKYGIKPENVIRHFDVTGKYCPRPWLGKDMNTYYHTTGDAQWEKFKERIGDEVVENSQMIVDGKVVPVERILKNGTNYVKIRDVAAALDLNVSNRGNIPVLTTK